MNYKLYHKSDLFIESSTENVKFRRYIENDNQRLLLYIEGTLTDILPQDFDNLSILRNGIFYRPILLVLGGSTYDSNLLNIEFNDNITQIGTDATRNNPSISFSSPNELPCRIIFPKKLLRLYGSFGVLMNSNITTWDFSKVLQVPTWYWPLTDDGTEEDQVNCFAGTILVPSSLYNSWINNSKWKHLKDDIYPI